MSRLDWNREGLIWPHRDASEFVNVGRARWHVQRMGSGPPLLLLHGTGASVHSWRGLMPLLAQTHTVIAPDLPRHAFTSGHDAYAMSLPAMAGEVAGLLKTLDVQPAAIIGHSAGAAIALQMALDHAYRGPIIGLNSALRPFPGAMAQIFPAVAKALFVNPQFTLYIKGMEESESRDLLDRLFRTVNTLEYHYRHRWEPDMLVMWDNRAVLHRATGGYEGHRRELHRTTIAAWRGS